MASEPSSIPAAVPPIPLDRRVPGLCWERARLRDIPGCLPPASLREVAFGPVAENTPVEVEEDTFVVVGKRLGCGRQGVVYHVATCPEACIKLCKNERSAKQFRRELLGVAPYLDAGVPFPPILGADGFGLWIVKSLWNEGQLDGVRVLGRHNRLLPASHVHSLHEYVTTFERRGWCIDGLPTNVVFTPQGCGNYETTLWRAPPDGTWTFARCFLPLWLPDPVDESSLDGFPPFHVDAQKFERLRLSWETALEYTAWRETFGAFPDLCPDWWTVR
jgi:hypothetical protein